MSKRRLAVEYAELTDEGKIVRITFSRPLSRLEADGVIARIKEGLTRG